MNSTFKLSRVQRSKYQYGTSDLSREFGRILADYAYNLINLYSGNVTSLAALVGFVG
jgi:hypothetical protein